MKLSEYREKVSEKKAEKNLLVSQINKLIMEEEEYFLKMEDLEEVRVIFQKAAQITQKQISYHIENIVSHALAVVFDDPYQFKVDFVTRRNVTECDLLFVSGESEMHPLDSCGYGAADIASLALRVAYWKLSKDSRNTLILDEPTRNLSLDKQPLASQIIRELAKELKIQFLVVTHNVALTEEAETVFKVEKIGNVSKIKQI